MSKLSQTMKMIMAGAAMTIFAQAADAAGPDTGHTNRERITLQDYCERQKQIFATDPTQFTDLVVNYTPFEARETATSHFTSRYGNTDVTVPSETFTPICNPRLDQWGPQDIQLLETGLTIAAGHSSLGALNARDPANIATASAAAANDYSLRSRETRTLMAHLAFAHAIAFKESDGKTDTPEFAELKRQALDDLILN